MHSYVLSNGDIADDLERPITTPVSSFCTAFHVFISDVDTAQTLTALPLSPYCQILILET